MPMTRAQAAPTPGKPRVLVVDDDNSICQVVQKTLVASGFTVDAAPNGLSGLQLLLQKSFDVAVVDLVMQGMDGFAFIQEAKTIWPWLGFVIVTSFPGDESKAQAAQLGVNRFLEKPFDPHTLRQEVLAEALEKDRKLMATPSQNPERLQQQLRELGRFAEKALNTSDQIESLIQIATGLAPLVPCDVVGIFEPQEDEHVMILNTRKAVSKSFVEFMEQEIVRRYETLSGRRFQRGSLHIQTIGPPPSPTGPQVPSEILTLPIIVEGATQGLLLLAADGSECLPQQDIAFLHHAITHIATLFAAGRRMRQLAVHDSMTGLYNRAFLEQELERAWQLSRRYGHSITVAMLDLDHFKTMNDTYGHLVGDQILCEFSNLLKQASRASDVVARYGGDEFTILFPEGDLANGISFGTRLAGALAEFTFCKETLKLKLTVSIGTASSQSSGPTASAHELLARADQALYAAKQGGRNTIRIWTDNSAQKPALAVNAPMPVTIASQADATPPTKGKILVVDDDPNVGRYLSNLLTHERYEVAVKTSAEEAFQHFMQNPQGPDIVITDLKMPGRDGIDLIHKIHNVNARIVAILITGFATKENVIESLRQGVFDLVEKPVDPAELAVVVEKALEHRRLLIENESYQTRLEEKVREKSTALAEALNETRQSYLFALEALVALLDAREHETGRHSVRVRDMTIILASEMGLTEQSLEHVGHGALLHDIGKIAIPDAIILKPGPLTDEEWKIMRTHPEVGHQILSSNRFFAQAAEIVLSHQERYDGSGYPRGLHGKDINLGARIFAVIDAYDAMRASRPYSQSRTPEEAAGEIKSKSGTQFDPDVVSAFLRCQPRIEKALNGHP